MTRLSITIATWNYDRVLPIMDGRVRVDGCDVNYVTVSPEECFHRAWIDSDFDVTELGVCGYLAGLDRGVAPYVALPIHLSRMFRHSAIYVRTDRAIHSPGDLRGKRIGIPEWPMAAGLWVRGMLGDVYGVDIDEINWVQGGQRQPGRQDKYPHALPSGFPLKRAPEGHTLESLVRDGDLDGLVTARTPTPYTDPTVPVERLFEDYETAERSYYAETGIFPIMHCLGIRRDLHEKHPWLAANLLKANREANRIAQAEMFELTALKISMPWIGSAAESARQILGVDLWPYGVESSRITLEAMVRYAHEQGVTSRQIDIGELFATSTYQEPKI